mgnify:CR=1 FL=1
MAITNADILGWLNANPNADDDLIYKTMIEAGVTTEQYLSATGKPLPRSTATPKVTNADILGWLNANPGASPALINETMKAAGVTSAQYQSATGLALPTVAAPAPMPLPVSVANTQPPVPQVSTPQAAPTPPQAGMLTGPAQAPPVSTVTNADILGWLNANPNATPALINETMKAAGVSANQYLSATGKPLAGSQATGVGGIFPEGMLTNTQLTSVPDNPLVKLYQDTLGRTPSKEEIEGWGFGDTIDAQELDRFLGAARREAVETMPKTGAVGNIANQILAQGTTDKWAGEGFGSPQKNAYDMAVMLAGQGFTDINQFGERTNPEGKKEYFNKATGEAVKSYYDRAGDDIWGGTFTGKDSTAYGVSFDPAGKPLFYSKSGGDSADVPSWVAPALILGAAYFGLDASGLLGGLGGTSAATLTAAEAAGLGLTAAEASALGLSASEFAAAGGLGAGFTAAGLPSGTGAFLGEGVASGIPAWDTAFTSAGGLFNPAFGLPNVGGADVTTTTGRELAAAQSAGGVPPTAIPTGAPSTGLPPTGLPATVQNALTKAGVSTAVNSLLGTGGTSNIGSILNTGLTTGAGLLQQQTSREAALAAQQRIDAETAAAKASAAFRPVGMTTRFGTSQFQVDPVTGQLTSAGYTLSPEAKAQQDRFMALSQQGLTQAEQAQQQFAPLQTGAQRLFGLGNQYLAQSPEAVAQNYLNQQMALLQPGRELELANLQNRLQQQGRGGLAVAQGGAYGATTPELQALFNARAQQEAQLAANAQQFGQQNVAFGAGLLGTGAQTMGQYYGGQQAAYAPYTTAMGQVQGLEALGQQPFQMGATLGQTASTAGARAGALGLEGANISQRLATGSAATTNPYSTALGGVASNPAFGQLLGGLFSSGAPVNALSSSAYGPGIAGYESMLQDIYG